MPFNPFSYRDNKNSLAANLIDKMCRGEARGITPDVTTKWQDLAQQIKTLG